VDPGRARWRQVLEHTTPRGLAPLNSSSPSVGAVGYLVGGGAGLLGRRFGFAADHVRRLRLVTADGRLREVTAEADPDLFWAVRGGKDNFGLVVGMELDLFPVSRLYGGGLYFAGEATAEVLHAYADWTRHAPEEMASSVLVGTIHHEPTSMPYVAYDRNLLLTELTGDAVDTIIALAGSGAAASFVTGLRHFGGAYARPPEVPNCVGGREAAFSLFTGAVPETEILRRRDDLLARLRPWSTGGTNLNFAGVEDTGLDRVRAAYAPADFDRLRTLKARHDPHNMFRINFNIPPKESLN
jgi:FAD/FMN-containing dehydrogenase